MPGVLNLVQIQLNQSIHSYDIIRYHQVLRYWWIIQSNEHRRTIWVGTKPKPKKKNILIGSNQVD